MEKKTLGIVTVGVFLLVFVGGLVFARGHARESGNYHEGTVTHVSCINAGVGCVEYTLVTDNSGDGVLALDGVSDATLRQYIGKKVQVKGKVEQLSYPPKTKFVEVESISLK